jgi:hypothetical protein
MLVDRCHSTHRACRYRIDDKLTVPKKIDPCLLRDKTIDQPNQVWGRGCAIQVQLQSAVGHGTTVTIYFLR